MYCEKSVYKPTCFPNFIIVPFKDVLYCGIKEEKIRKI